MSDLIPGLEEAEKMVKARLNTAKSLYVPAYIAALDDILVFIQAELSRQRNPETAAYTTLD